VFAVGERPPFSLHPLHAPDSVITAPELVGDWVRVSATPDTANTLQVAEEGTYRLRITVPIGETTVTGWGYASAIDGVTFLDWGAPGWSMPVPQPFPVMPVHVFVRFRIVGDTLFLDFVTQDDWAARLANRPGLAIRQGSSEDPEDPALANSGAVLLTPPTEQLRALVRELLRADDVVWKTTTLVRRGHPST
jgi:hypothetical protein